MKQMTFADAEYAGNRKQSRKKRFLIEMDQVVPWEELVNLIEPHYPKAKGPSGLSVDGSAAHSSDAKLVRLGRRSSRRGSNPKPN